MEPLFDSEVVGVDILLYFVDDEGVAPSPSEVPLPSFGCQGIDVPRTLQEVSGRDIPETPVVEQAKEDDRKCPFEESSSSSPSRSRTPAAESEDSDRSVKHRPKPKINTRAPRGSVGIALQEKRRRQKLGAVGFCNSAMQVDASSADDASDVSIMQDLADRAVILASSRQVETTALATLFSTPASTTSTFDRY